LLVRIISCSGVAIGCPASVYKNGFAPLLAKSAEVEVKIDTKELKKQTQNICY